MDSVPAGVDLHRQHLRRGFNWLGTATVAAKVIDFATVLVLLTYLTKAQVGQASLVISIGMIIEALNGLGTGEALIQAPRISRLQTDSLFWYVLGGGMAAALLTIVLAPAIGAIYGLAPIVPLFWCIAAKQPAVAAALVPLALMNRGLRYRRIAVINLCATVAAALTRLGLAAAGAGAAALVVGYASSGWFLLIGALAASRFRPGLRLSFASIRPLVQFGWRAASASLADQLFKNIDFLLVGWFYGAAPLAIYRVAFDIAMEPAMAVGTLVNRIALPVFARVAGMADQLGPIVAWSLRRIVVLVAPLMVGVMLAATPLLKLIHDDQGHNYAAAVTPLRLLALAALLRVVAQLLPTLLLATGRPGVAARLAGATFLLLCAGAAAAGLLLPASLGIVAVAAIWLAIYPPVLAWGMRVLRRDLGLDLASLARAIAAPVASVTLFGMAGIAAISLAAPWGARAQLAMAVLATGIGYAALAWREARNR